MSLNDKAVRELAVWLTGPDMAWMEEAECARPENADLPWTADAGDASPAEVARMTRACASCLARTDCALFASGVSGNDVTAGFWAARERGRVEVPDLLDMLNDGVPVGSRAVAV